MRKDIFAADVRAITPHYEGGYQRIAPIIALMMGIVERGDLTVSNGRRIYIYADSGAGMAKAKAEDFKKQALQQDGVLNPHPEAVRDPLFAGNPFFDPNDLVQVRYEMVRSHKVDGLGVSEAAALFGVSRPTFYKTESALDTAGLVGLLPAQRGPKAGHKLSPDVIDFAVALKASDPGLTEAQCLEAIETHFGVKAHRRSLERALSRKKKRLDRS